MNCFLSHIVLYDHFHIALHPTSFQATDLLYRLCSCVLQIEIIIQPKFAAGVSTPLRLKRAQP